MNSKMRNLIFLLLILTVITSCSGFKDAGKVLRNEKTISNDEFLVKKRSPLVLPPNFEKIPEPGSIKENKDNDETKIKKILQAPKIGERSKNNPSSIEESILEKIHK